MKTNAFTTAPNYFTHQELMLGGTIVYDVGNVPNKQRGIQEADAPYSFTTERRR